MKSNLLILLLVLPALICTFNAQHKFVAFADGSAEDDLVDVEAEDGAVTGEDVEADEDPDSTSTTSPYADTFLLFTKPLYTAGQQLDLPGGKPVEFLIGFTNKGKNDFVIETVEASFRYPMDFNYHIQNFSAVAYNREVKPGSEATVAYSFLPSDTFAGRPFGLNIALNYRDSLGGQFSEAVFNETVLISEIDEGLDGETFFLYVLLAGIVVLLLVIGQQYLLGSSGKRKRAAAKKTIETGTSNDSNIEYEWLPQETLRVLQQSPPKSKALKTSPKPGKQSSPKQGQSPKQRKVKRTAGDD
ncbi:PREDICTED: translocon-associated protein subunit alpha-like [Rhagoletis zephyria]|uniref:translocon-associated protein subunit alpha-like n=1 Tax=Rhagoletis zephyria TaxID=28612 RepID=UPI00081139B0|nr:PREDICTED: translocon-associated protein subunit alpha-like [Rhagoletis zephyria]